MLVIFHLTWAGPPIDSVSVLSVLGVDCGVLFFDMEVEEMRARDGPERVGPSFTSVHTIVDRFGIGYDLDLQKRKGRTMKRWLIISSAACLVIVGTAVGSVQMGDTELNLSGGLLTENAGNQGGLNLDSWKVAGGFGYFTTDNIEVGAVGLFSESSERWNNPDKTTRMLKRDANIYAFGAQAKYHFMPENQLVPYIGGQILWADVKVSERFNDADVVAAGGNWTRDKQGILWGPLAGLRYQLNEQNDVFVEYQYQLWASNIRDIMKDGHALTVGLIHKFK